MQEYFIKETIKEATKSLLSDDVPIGAIIIKNNKIIARGHNCREKTKKITGHAEIQAIEKLAKKNKNWHLNEYTMYISLEPCLMCYEAIVQSRIKNVIYLSESELYGFTNYNLNKVNKLTSFELIEYEEAKKLLQKFFKNKRK